MKNKNKNLLLLVGVGIAYYFFYKMYQKKSTNNVIKNPVMPPVLNDLTRPITDVISVTNVPNQFLVDKVPTAELDYQANTYQTYYGSMAGNNYKVPSTC
jgi:hypothetical protein